MLLESEINEIRSILENANNPFYLFDDDGDGLCSYLLLKKHYKKGIGMPIKNPGPLDTKYISLIEEEKPDLVVLLDKALVTQEFIDACPCQVLYIDHHPIQNLKKLKYFNPLFHNKDCRIPTSELVYSVVKTNMWIAMIGCLFDYRIPYFIKEFTEQYKDLIEKESKDPGDLFYKTTIGKLTKVLDFNLKGNRKEIRKAIRYLEKIETPYELLNKTTEGAIFVYDRYEKLNKEYLELKKQAESKATRSKILLFIYEVTKTSFNTELATELSYKYPNKMIILAREKDDVYKLSIRDQKKDIAEIYKKAIEGLDAYGGGHPHACGGAINKKDFNELISRITRLKNEL